MRPLRHPVTAIGRWFRDFLERAPLLRRTVVDRDQTGRYFLPVRQAELPREVVALQTYPRRQHLRDDHETRQQVILSLGVIALHDGSQRRFYLCERFFSDSDELSPEQIRVPSASR